MVKPRSIFQNKFFLSSYQAKGSYNRCNNSQNIFTIKNVSGYHIQQFTLFNQSMYLLLLFWDLEKKDGGIWHGKTLRWTSFIANFKTFINAKT